MKNNLRSEFDLLNCHCSVGYTIKMSIKFLSVLIFRIPCAPLIYYDLLTNIFCSFFCCSNMWHTKVIKTLSFGGKRNRNNG